VVDAIAGTSVEAHRAALERVTQAGGKPISWVSLACELQRDWGARSDRSAVRSHPLHRPAFERSIRNRSRRRSRLS
jgi:hypothetical protein